MKFLKKKTVFMSIIIAAVAANAPACAYVPGQDGIETYEQGRYGHTYISPKSVVFERENALENLTKFVDHCKTEDSGHAIYMQILYDDMRLCSLLKKAGFEYRETWFETVEKSNERKDSGQVWMIQNNSSVPAQASFVEASRCYIVKDGYFLMVLSKRMGWTAAGGSHEKGDTSISTVVREVEEELGLTINPENLDLKAIIERTPLNDNCGPKTAADTMFYYAYPWKGERIAKDKLVIQTSELEDADWIHWSDILNNPDIGDHIKLTISATMEGTLDNPKFLAEDRSHKLSFKLPDFHTRYKNQSMKIAQAKIWNPEMTMSFSLTTPTGGGTTEKNVG